MRILEDDELGRVPAYVVAAAEKESTTKHYANFSNSMHALADECKLKAAACDGKVYGAVSQQKFIKVKLQLEHTSSKLTQPYAELKKFCQDNNVTLIERGRSILMRIS